jgi:hypothetical protein
MNIGRRRSVLIEKIINRKTRDVQSTDRFFQSISDVFRKDRFFVEMERNDGSVLNPYRICGFKIDDNKDSKILKVKTTLEINEWIADYEKVVIVRIFLYDSSGNDLINMDFDVIFRGYSMECDYHSDEAMKPIFSYAIIGE